MDTKLITFFVRLNSTIYLIHSSAARVKSADTRKYITIFTILSVNLNQTPSSNCSRSQWGLSACFGYHLIDSRNSRAGVCAPTQLFLSFDWHLSIHFLFSLSTDKSYFSSVCFYRFPFSLGALRLALHLRRLVRARSVCDAFFVCLSRCVTHLIVHTFSCNAKSSARARSYRRDAGLCGRNNKLKRNFRADDEFVWIYFRAFVFCCCCYCPILITEIFITFTAHCKIYYYFAKGKIDQHPDAHRAHRLCNVLARWKAENLR